MRILNGLRQFLTLSLALSLVSCGGIRAVAHPKAEELNGFVLIVEDAPDGNSHHSWRHAAEVDLLQYDGAPRFPRVAGDIVLASRRSRDCDEEHTACYRGCMKRKLPSNFGHIEYGSARHINYCNSKCLAEYEQCLESQGRQFLRFPAVDGAVDWLKRHRTELLAGTLVVIAGATFVVVSAGAGVLVLAPLVLMTSAGGVSESRLAGVAP
jgi:hypothetical protein